MKQIGFLLLIGGFLGGAYATAIDLQATDWTLFVPAAVVALLGLVMIKRASRGAARAEHVLTANKAELESSLARVIGELEDLVGRAAEVGTDALRGELDARLRDDLRRFADARESMVHLFGMQAYADVMSDFAAGERNVNRVWSASTDGYREEALVYLERALGRFREARQQLDRAVRTTRQKTAAYPG